MKNLPNIRRVETGRTKGWQFHAVANKKPNTKLFSDSKYGGKRNSRKAAVAYRDKFLPKIRKTRIRYLDPRNNTGHSRIQVTTEWSGGGIYERVRASLVVDGKVKTKSWPLSKFSIREGVKLALLWQKRIKRQKTNG